MKAAAGVFYTLLELCSTGLTEPDAYFMLRDILHVCPNFVSLNKGLNKSYVPMIVKQCQFIECNTKLYCISFYSCQGEHFACVKENLCFLVPCESTLIHCCKGKGDFDTLVQV